MAIYYLNQNQQDNGDYEVHIINCLHGALPQNQIQLGWFTGCSGAVAEARRRFPDIASLINGCYYCSNACHTS